MRIWDGLEAADCRGEEIVMTDTATTPAGWYADSEHPGGDPILGRERMD